MTNLSPEQAIRRLSWDDLRLFLAVTESGSYRAAAREGVASYNTLRLAVERVEYLLKIRLLERLDGPKGVELTSAGARIERAASAMRTTLKDYLS